MTNLLKDNNNYLIITNLKTITTHYILSKQWINEMYVMTVRMKIVGKEFMNLIMKEKE